MILPLVSSLSEDAMYAVPQSLRNAGYALGSSKLQVAVNVVIPSAFSGITASFVLAISRAIGETMLVAIAAGQMPNLTLNPLKPVMTMTTFIVQVSLGDTPTGTIEYQTIFAVGMVLFLLTFALNVAGHKLRRRYREIYE
jgi:phosphate transport system permease protein